MSSRAANKAMLSGIPPKKTDSGPQIRESSKKQAERIRREQAEKTRSTHRKIFKKIDPNSTEGRKLAKKEKEAAAAEQAFAEMLKRQEEESLQLINQWREEAKEKEREKRVQTLALKWKTGTREARFYGPYSIPQKIGEADELFAELRKTPRGAVVAFLLALFRKGYNRALGNQMLASALHKDCVTDDGTVRKFTLKCANKIDSQILASYVLSATPANGYEFNQDNIKFEFDNIHTPKVFDKTEGNMVQVYLVTNGPLPTYPSARPVDVKYSDGLWGVRTFNKLTTAVEVGKCRRHSLIDDDGENEYADYKAVRRNEHESWTAAPDFAAMQRRRKARGETEEKKEERRSRAQAEVQGLAGRLATRDLKKEWSESNPNESRRLVDGSGTVKTVTLDTLDTVLNTTEVKAEEDPERPVEDEPTESVPKPDGDRPEIQVSTE
eukprot:m.443364 g.443364  ORF g.443364 m.443364 type:complete len:439 (-) comp18958_c0_seq1:117-1433(-)